jgi:RNA polymerase sigma-70 factor (ECF subfamily)
MFFMNPMSDSATFDSDELIARARAGDQAAWEALFRTCYPKVIRVVRRKLDRPLRSLYDSTDFVSDVMKSLAANIDRLDFPSMGSLIAFLAQAAEQKVIDEYRRRHTLKRDITRERALVGPDGTDIKPMALPSPDPTASQVAQADEARERLLAGQDEMERMVIELRGLGYTNVEIAERTGWNIRKVQRFLKDLHDSLQNEGDN